VVKLPSQKRLDEFIIKLEKLSEEHRLFKHQLKELRNDVRFYSKAYHAEKEKRRQLEEALLLTTEKVNEKFDYEKHIEKTKWVRRYIMQEAVKLVKEHEAPVHRMAICNAVLKKVKGRLSPLTILKHMELMCDTRFTNPPLLIRPRRGYYTINWEVVR